MKKAAVAAQSRGAECEGKNEHKKASGQGGSTRLEGGGRESSRRTLTEKPA